MSSSFTLFTSSTHPKQSMQYDPDYITLIRIFLSLIQFTRTKTQQVMSHPSCNNPAETICDSATELSNRQTFYEQSKVNIRTDLSIDKHSTYPINVMEKVEKVQAMHTQ